ncbi:MAG TPA: PD-(D/E)XK nuclease family protein [Acidimicrobiia bacterium]
MHDVEVLPRVTPASLRGIHERCPRQVALDFVDEGFSDAVNRGRLRDAFLECARAGHGSSQLPSVSWFRAPEHLEPEEQRVFEHVARWYVHLYGDRGVTLHLNDCDHPTERRGVRVGGWVDLTVEHADGTKELRQLDLWRGRRPVDDPLEIERVWVAVLRLRLWVGDGSLLVSWADLVDGARCERVVDLRSELPALVERFDERLAAIRARADTSRVEPGAGCAWCRHLTRCPAHDGAMPVRAPRRDPRPGVLRLTPTSLDTWQRCRRAWWLQHVLEVPASDQLGSPDHGQLVHDVLRFVHTAGSCHDDAHVEDVLVGHGSSGRLRDEIARHAALCPSPAEALGHEVSFARFTAARPALASFLVTARLDAVWVHDGLLDARDYKTGVVTTARVADDPRAWLQAWVLAPTAARRGLRIRLRYEHLASEIQEEPEPWEPDADDLAVVEERLRAEVRQMRDEVSFAGVADPEVCTGCRYRSICRDTASPGVPTWPEVLET